MKTPSRHVSRRGGQGRQTVGKPQEPPISGEIGHKKCLTALPSRQVSRLGRHGEFVNSALAYAILGVLNITTGFHAGWFG
jgi:hypothetical protein